MTERGEGVAGREREEEGEGVAAAGEGVAAAGERVQGLRENDYLASTFRRETKGYLTVG